MFRLCLLMSPSTLCCVVLYEFVGYVYTRRNQIRVILFMCLFHFCGVDVDVGVDECGEGESGVE